ncbi:hypothetical protein LWF15_19600 [Kineosporia rhizophila]|uniref:hypothetical protein n=1 Tax=Kineosporia TaxID=49184 RepID=UPI001E5682B1|nr:MULTISPECIES: hypothetical protein [Kineosporia]MCE0537700.1 hypothetical protein [Kineosporia rhizophila]GLY14895.1 glycosyl transferase [Kineosporia sp. NBRC 101677]
MIPTSTRTAPGPRFEHLRRLSTGPGLFEHADHQQPRPEHGYCLDDVSRALVVVCREPDPDRSLQELAQTYLDFTLAALQPDGSFHNRMRADGSWADAPVAGDWWGRAVWGLGVAATRGPTLELRRQAMDGFTVASRARVSPHHLRPGVFAALGATEVAAADPGNEDARELLRDVVRTVGVPSAAMVDPFWPWPERRLRYANAAVPEAMIVAGTVLQDRAALDHGFRLLDFLVRIETRDRHFSVTPVGGRDRAAAEPGFDQQPIEVSSLADACARAYDLSGDERWRRGVRTAWAWFLGDNDSRTPMFDAETGAGFDGLLRAGRNLNQGAESTLAALSTAQQAQRLGVFS